MVCKSLSAMKLLSLWLKSFHHFWNKSDCTSCTSTAPVFLLYHTLTQPIPLSVANLACPFILGVISGVWNSNSWYSQSGSFLYLFCPLVLLGADRLE